MYKIRYNTGAGDDEADTLDGAMRKASRGARYTQSSIDIYYDDGSHYGPALVARRAWYPYGAATNRGTITIGGGHYGPWRDADGKPVQR